ncbi:MAG: DUF1028 domain-containing protein, partial [Myxococcota bacterium]
LRQIATPTVDSRFDERQYAMVTVDGDAAGFTGDQTLPFAADRQRRTAAFALSVQGNILTGESVLDRLEAGFLEEACDLPERLMRSVEAGGTATEGDSRCTPGLPADAAYLQVDRPDEPAGSYLVLQVQGARTDPVRELRRQFDRWRVNHPCVPVVGSVEGPSMPEPTAPPARAGGCTCGAGSEPGPPWRAGAVLSALLFLGLRRVRQRQG